MPFKSEKQRRFLWAAHPDIAKRWAHEYPNQKKLPMYAHNNKADGNPAKADENQPAKTAALRVLKQAVLANNSHAVLQLMQNSVKQYAGISGITKKSTSILQYVDVPHSGKPVAAGDEPVKPKQDIGCNTEANSERQQPDLMQLFSKQEKQDEHGMQTAQKLAVVLAEKFRAPDAPANAGLDVETMRRKVHEDKMKQLYGSNPLPLGEQQKQQQPAQPAQQIQQQKPNVTSNNLAGNVIGKQGPLNSHHGKPTQEQNVTGNQAFGSANAVPGITEYGIT